jgi:hypothetical protein
MATTALFQQFSSVLPKDVSQQEVLSTALLGLPWMKFRVAVSVI